jgi:DNA polymerase-3 subunit alpha
MCNSKQDFVHLHAHTHFSIQDALPSPQSYAFKAREMGFRATAITDHGKLGGVCDFVDGCRSTAIDHPAIKPIIGIEVYTCPDRFDKSKTEDNRRQKLNHLTLLAQNETGYKNLLRITEYGADPNAFYYSPRVDWNVLQQHSEGVIALSGCLASELSQALIKEDQDESENVVKKFKDLYGDRYFIELQYHGIEEQKNNLPKLLNLANRFGVKYVASNDVHYLDAQDWKLHDILIQMRDLREASSGVAKKNGKKEAYGTHQFYLKSFDDMMKIFSKKPDALTNTLDLADSIEDFFKIDVPHLLPAAIIPKNNQSFINFKQKNLPYHKENEAYLAYLAMSGLKKAGLDKNTTYKERLKYELKQIWHMGVTDYFLIQRELVEFMKQDEILFGIRGSGVGSLVNFCLEVCPVDPVKWGLLFERFLNPGRGTQYDIDFKEYSSKEYIKNHGVSDQSIPTLALKNMTDKWLTEHPEFADKGPEIAKELWVLENQGLSSYYCELLNNEIKVNDNSPQSWVAYITGISNQMPETDLKVAKVAPLPDVDTDVDDSKRDRIINWARNRFGEENVAQIGTWGTYKAKAAVLSALKTSERFNQKYGSNVHQEALRITATIPKMPDTTIESALMDSPEFKFYYSIWTDEIEVAKKLVGTISNFGIHAAGVLISKNRISDATPIENSKGTICSALEWKHCERVGLIKYDYLGLANLRQIDYAFNLIEERHGIKLSFESIPLEDPEVFKNIYAKGKTSSVFQCASKGMQDSLKLINPTCINDLIAIVALFRPGPKEYIPLYAQGKSNPKEIKYSHPIIEECLSDTYGIMVYQEQAMKLARDMAGFNWLEVDKLRKAISKKSGKDFDDACNLFRSKALEREFPEKAVNEVLSLMEKFGGYAFNKSHACAYAILSYWNAWLRYYYKNEWMASAIHTDKDDEDKLATYRRECALDGIQISSPSINESGTTTLVNNKGDIMLPLTSIKGVGTRVEDLIKMQPFDDIDDFATRARPNRGMVKALAENGALDCLLTGKSFHDIDSFLEYWDEIVEKRNQIEKQKIRDAKRKFVPAGPTIATDSSNGKISRESKTVERKISISSNLFNDDLFD